MTIILKKEKKNKNKITFNKHFIGNTGKSRPFEYGVYFNYKHIGIVYKKSKNSKYWQNNHQKNAHYKTRQIAAEELLKHQSLQGVAHIYFLGIPLQKKNNGLIVVGGYEKALWLNAFGNCRRLVQILISLGIMQIKVRFIT